MSRSVLLLVRELGVGGCERDLTKLALNLDRQRYTPHVGSFFADGMRADELKAAGVPMMHFPVRSLFSVDALRLAAKMRRYVRQHQIELIHAFDMPTGVWAAPTRLLGGPRMITSHLWQRRFLPSQSQFLLRCVDRLPDAMICNSESTRRELIEQEGLRGEKIFTVHNGVQLETFHPVPGETRPAPLRDAEIVIGTACVLRAEKRLDLLMEAFARVRRPGVKLLIVGSGALLPALERQRDTLGLQDCCHFEPQKDLLAPWLRALDVYVLSSETESFPNALLEAMACGCAVVGSAVGGVPELIDDGSTGLLFPAGDVGALEDRLRQLIDNPSRRRQFGEASAQRARDEFRMELNSVRTQSIYDLVLS